MLLISSGDRRPNCISWIVRSGALEYVKLRFAILADKEITTQKEVKVAIDRSSSEIDAY
jgi:hypothetical protein